MKLHTGQSLWMSRSTNDCIDWPMVSGSCSTDVAIVGAGVTGALAADALADEGVQTLLIDQRLPACGSTAASTALLMYELDTSLVSLRERYGVDVGDRCYAASLRAVKDLQALAGQLDDSCECSWTSSLYFASQDSHARQFEAECRARREAGIPVDLWDRSEIESHFSFSAPAALVSHHAGQIDPMRLTRTLLQRAVSRGLQVHAPTQIVAVESDSHDAMLRTADGDVIRARWVILAAGYELDQLLPLKLGSLHSSYVICSQPGMTRPLWHGDWLIWESARPYAYLRTTSDGRVLIGGGDVPFKNVAARDALIDLRSRTLQRRFHELFPQLSFNIEHAWAGTFGESDDGLPIIDRVPSHPMCMFAAGYGGNGVTFGMLAAKIMRDACLGRRHPDADLFTLDRFLR